MSKWVCTRMGGWIGGWECACAGRKIGGLKGE